MAATSAFAQSSVEIYGVIDQSVGQTTTKVNLGAPDNVGIKLSQQNTGVQGGLATQRIGFRGTEDLGGGTRALFQIESSLSAGGAGDNGFGSRPTFVGLSNTQIGTLTFGRQDTPLLKAVLPQLAGGANNAIGQIMWSGFTVLVDDPTKTPGAQDGLSRIANQTTIDRAINFKSATYNGLDAEVQYGKAQDKLSATRTPLDNDAIVETGLNIKYATDKLTLNAANHVRKITANSVTTGKFSTNYVGATYDFGVAKLSLQHATDKLANTTGGSFDYKNKGTQFGLQVPVSDKVDAFGSYGTGKRDFGANDVFKQTSYQMGATYSFSKRTKLYGIYGSQQLKADTAQNAGDSLKQTQFLVGLNHRF